MIEADEDAFQHHIAVNRLGGGVTGLLAAHRLRPIIGRMPMPR